jgi:hypothetical protein
VPALPEPEDRRRLPSEAAARSDRPVSDHLNIDRPLRGLEELRTAVAMLKAISRDDPGAVMLLGEHADQVHLMHSSSPAAQI